MGPGARLGAHQLVVVSLRREVGVQVYIFIFEDSLTRTPVTCTVKGFAKASRGSLIDEFRFLSGPFGREIGVISRHLPPHLPYTMCRKIGSIRYRREIREMTSI